MLISFVIPCYYSEDTIGKEVLAVMDQFKLHEGYECEFVLVNDGSTDGTFDVIRSLCDQYPNVRNNRPDTEYKYQQSDSRAQPYMIRACFRMVVYHICGMHCIQHGQTDKLQSGCHTGFLFAFFILLHMGHLPPKYTVIIICNRIVT